ncbi:hypothetical protein NXU87_00715 [Candidatus Bacteroides intestinigallinarum]|nr:MULTISPECIES: hypothetical protein [Bacteroides]MCS3174637.1 hypothetical protein [Candidatus Bacteroides intestinigallinarum]
MEIILIAEMLNKEALMSLVKPIKITIFALSILHEQTAAKARSKLVG